MKINNNNLYKTALAELSGMAQMPPAERLKNHTFAAALSAADNPQFAWSRAQVIGTNGKGSASFFLAKILSAHGVKCGLYTSPHLITLRERIMLDGKMISEQDFGLLYAQLRPVFEKFNLTHFERLTLLAATYFRRMGASFAVLETGIGGAGDAVTALGAPTLLFTTISLEHRDMLGGTIREIAAKKAAPLEQCARAFASPQTHEAAGGILRTRAASSGAMLTFSKPVDAAVPTAQGTAFTYRGRKFSLPMFGAHYAQNAALAIDAAAYILGDKFSYPTATQELLGAAWPGRLQIYHFKQCNRLLVSCAHNDESLDADISVLQGLLAKDLFPGDNLKILAGISGNRDGKAFIKKIAALGGEITVTKVPGHAGAFADISRAPGVKTIEDIALATRQLIGPQPQKKGGVIVIGSIYLAGALLGLLEPV